MNVIDEIQLPGGWTEGSRPKVRFDSPVVDDDYRSLRGDNESMWTDGIREWLIQWDNIPLEDFAALYRFYICRYGKAIGFLFTDSTDRSSNPNHVGPPTMLDQPIVQDTEGNWRLCKMYGDRIRYILRPTDILLSNGGSPVSATVDPLTGIIDHDFTGGLGKAGFYFSIPVTFVDDFYDFNYGPEVRSVRTSIREMKWPYTTT